MCTCHHAKALKDGRSGSHVSFGSHMRRGSELYTPIRCARMLCMVLTGELASQHNTRIYGAS